MNLKNAFLRVLVLCLLMLTGISGFTQEADDKTDSLFAARLTEDNLELYSQIDSLNILIKNFKAGNSEKDQQVASLTKELEQIRIEMALSMDQFDTLGLPRLRAKQDLLTAKQQLQVLNTTLEQKITQLLAKELQLKDCLSTLREVKLEASVSEAKLEGKNNVTDTKVEAKDREIAYQQETIKEKERIINEKTTELASINREKTNSIRLIDSLARILNARELELSKVNDRLKMIESEYNEIIAQRTASQNRKKKIRIVQGAAIKFFRTPNWQSAPQSSTSTATYVITNKNSGLVEFDYITGVSISLYDLGNIGDKYTYDAGLYLGFGGSNLFKNFYIAPSVKAFDFFHFMLGLNFAEYEKLKSGFHEGDPFDPGRTIPTVKQWKATGFFGMTIDFELLSNISKKLF